MVVEFQVHIQEGGGLLHQPKGNRQSSVFYFARSEVDLWTVGDACLRVDCREIHY